MRGVREVGGGRRGFPHPVSCFWANCAFGGGQRRVCSPQKLGATGTQLPHRKGHSLWWGSRHPMFGFS